MRSIRSLAAVTLLAGSASAAQAARFVEPAAPAAPLFFPALAPVDPDVAFTVLAPDATVELRAGRVRMRLPAAVAPRPAHARGLDVSRLAPPGAESFWRDPALATATVVDLELVGASSALPVGADAHPATVTVFRGGPEDWRSGQAQRAVRYEDAWPGIAMAWRGVEDALKYAFELAPGADASLVRLRVTGAHAVAVAPDGALEIAAGSHVLRDAAPVAWEVTAAGPVDVAAAWRVVPEPGGSFLVGFDVKRRDASLPLVIDPAIYVHATFLGTGIDDRGLGVAVDPAGNSYICGEAPNGTDYDAYVAKYDPAGAMVYFGYIGGDSYDAAYDIAVDAAGQAFLTGATSSLPPAFPAFVGPDLTYNGAQGDAFVAKVNAAGTALLYCGYLGGDGFDFAESVKVDAAGAAFVAGVVGSSQATFPVKVGPDLTYNGRYDTFVAKIIPNPNTGVVTSNLAYCGYIGGSSKDVGVTGNFYTNGHLAIDGTGHCYVSGMTQSKQGSFPDGDGFGALPGWDKTHGGGGYDGYVVKVNPTGSGLVWAGYIGGKKSDECFGLGVDAAGNAYVAGDTASPQTTFPVVMGPDLTYNGGTDAFVAKINATGTALVYCGYVGGSGLEQGLGLVVNPAGHAIACGHTHSADFPAVNGPDLTFNGAGRDVGDAWVAKVALVPSSPVVTANFDLCTFIGGSGEDSAYWVAVDGAGDLHVVGDTDSSGATFPDGDGFGPIPGDFQTANGGFDAFLVRITP